MPVYLIRAGEHGPVKIGFATSVRQRFAKMQTDNHEKLSVLRVLDGEKDVEAQLHSRFHALHRRGDWFEFSPDMTGDLGLPDFIPKPKPLPSNALARHLVLSGTPVNTFAREIGVSFQAVHRYVNGKRIPTRDVMQRIAEKTGGEVQANDFYESAA